MGMKWPALRLSLIAFAAVALVGASEPDPIGIVQKVVIDGVRMRVIEINLADPHVHIGIETANGFPRGSEAFGTMAKRAHATVAVDGGYFSKKTLLPIGDIVVGGKVVYQGMMGTALAITRNNDVTIRRVNRDHVEDWAGYETVLGCGPALVLDRRIDVDPIGERFHDPHVMHSTRRMGVALLLNRKMALVMTDDPVTFTQWAHVMYDYGATDAMNLDAGASMGMYVRGKTLVTPSRHITNILAVNTDR
jgi:exopolysaccharide biosynthesis protein